MSHRHYILQDHLIHILIASLVLSLIGTLSIVSARAEAQAGQSKTRVAVEIDADSAIGKKVLSYLVRELGEIPEFEVVSPTEKPAYVFMMLVVQETDNSDQPVGYALSTLIVEPTYPQTYVPLVRTDADKAAMEASVVQLLSGAYHILYRLLHTGPLENLKSACEEVVTNFHATRIRLREEVVNELLRKRTKEALQVELRELKAVRDRRQQQANDTGEQPERYRNLWKD